MHFQTRRTRIVRKTIVAAVGAICAMSCASQAFAAQSDSPQAVRGALQEARKQALSGRYFDAAVLYFNAATVGGAHQDVAGALLTDSVIRAGMPNAAAYFYIRTLQSGNKDAIRRILPHLPYMIEAVGGDLLRKYVLRHTSEADYDANTRNHFFYFLGKDELLKGDPGKALQALSKVTGGSGIMAQAAYLRGSAYSMLGQSDNATAAFKSCERLAAKAESRTRALREEYDDLEARCLAGQARATYQKGDHDDAEELYDRIPKSSFVWTDILFEQAWNSYAKGDYNRALGKLVTYRSPALNFVFNPEVDVLRAQSFLALCAYEDVNKTVNEFNARYANVGNQMKNFLMSHGNDLSAFYGLARQAYFRKLHTNNMLHRALNRFIRGPYFASLLAHERAIQSEIMRARRYGASGGGKSFANFLEKVLAWRGKTVRLLGGMFVHNFMSDLYQDLLANLDKMSFIKLEMLKHTKQTLERQQVMSEDEDGVLKRGSADIDRRDYQYFWTFNGEFWVDELGDYVFALESQCGS